MEMKEKDKFRGYLVYIHGEEENLDQFEERIDDLFDNDFESLGLGGFIMGLNDQETKILKDTLESLDQED